MLTDEQSKILEDYGALGYEEDASLALEQIRSAASSGEPQTLSFSNFEAEYDSPWLADIVEVDPVIQESGAKVTIPSRTPGSGLLVAVTPTGTTPIVATEGEEDLTAAEEEESARDASHLAEERVKEQQERQNRLGEIEDKGDEFLASRYRFAEQCYLMDNLTSLAGHHQRSQDLPSSQNSYGLLPNYKYNKVHILEGAGSTMLNKLKFRENSDALLNATPAELSNLIPMIKLFKVVYEGQVGEEGEVDYEIPFKFLSHTLADDVLKRDIVKADQNYLQPGSGRTGVGIKSFDWEYIATNPDTVRNDIKAKLVLYFQSFNDLLVCRNAITPDGESRKYRYLDLIVHAGGSSVCDEEPSPEGTTESDVPDYRGCGSQQTDYDSSFYEIRAVVGWAANNAEGLSLDLRKSITANQTALYLTLEEHEFGIGQDGTFTLTIHYRGRLEGILGSPKANVLNPAFVPHQDAYKSEVYGRLIDVQIRIKELKSGEICAEDEEFEKQVAFLQEEKLKLEDELRNLSYKKFATALENPSGRYGTEDNPYPMGDTTPYSSADVENRSSPMPLLYSLGVSQDQIERFVTLGTGKSTPGADVAGDPSTTPIEIGQVRQEGDPLQEMEDTIDDEAWRRPSQMWEIAREPAEMPENANYNLKDYSILDALTAPTRGGPAGAHAGRQIPGTLDVINFFYLGDLIDIIATDVFNNTAENWLDRYAEHSPSADEYDRDLSFRTWATREPKNIREMEDWQRNQRDIGDYDGPRSRYRNEDDLKQIQSSAIAAAEANAFRASEVENLRVLLGPVEYMDPLEPTKVRRINIADIPISFRLFVDFCQRNIIRKRRETYSFMEFIREMVQDLVLRAMGAECFGRNGARGLRVRTAFIEVPATEPIEEGGEGRDPIAAKSMEQLQIRYGEEGAKQRAANTRRLDMDQFHTGERMFDYSRSLQAKDSFQYIFIFAEGPAGLVHPSFPDGTDPRPEETDRNIKGIHHLHIGRDRGLLKTINFTKTDVPGMREARVEKSGTFDPIAQLSDVYEATITLFGNTFFYPGSYVYINPFGLGSHQKGGASRLGFPWERGSISNIMGLGGYHIIVNVSNYIEEGKFETTIRARFDASGDGCKITAAEDNNDTDCPEKETEPVNAESTGRAAVPRSLGETVQRVLPFG